MTTKTQQAKNVAEIFEEVITTILGIERRKMFGWTCVFIDGNMLGGFYNDQMMLRLSDKDREAFLQLPDTSIFNPKGNRPMEEYVDVSLELIQSSEDLARWFDKSFRYVVALPPKVKKARKQRSVKILRVNSRNQP